MTRMKKLEEETRRLEKIDVEESFKTESVRRLSQNKRSSISTAEDGAMGFVRAVSHRQARVSSI